MQKGRGKGERGMLGLAYDCGVGCDCLDLLCFWRPYEPVEVSWVVERREVLLSWVWIIHPGHTHTLHLVGLGLGGLGNLWRFPGLGIIS